MRRDDLGTVGEKKEESPHALTPELLTRSSQRNGPPSCSAGSHIPDVRGGNNDTRAHRNERIVDHSGKGEWVEFSEMKT